MTRLTFNPNAMTKTMREAVAVARVLDDGPRRDVHARRRVVWHEGGGGGRLRLQDDVPYLEFLGAELGRLPHGAVVLAR